MALVAKTEAIAFLTAIAATPGDLPAKESGECAVLHAALTSNGGWSRPQALAFERAMKCYSRAAQKYT